MFRKINVGNKDEDFKCSAATSILYKRLFGVSLTADITKLATVSKEAEALKKKLANISGEDKTSELVDLLANNTALVDLTNMMNQLIPQMAYIMWLEANKTQREVFQELTQEAFIMWLSGYEPDAIINSAGEFLDLWNATEKTNSSLKNV